MKKITVFTGTRADYGLLLWLMKAIESDKDLELQLLVTGTHLSDEFGLTYRDIENDGFHIDEKVEILLSSDTPVGVAKSMGLGVLGFTDSLSRLKPDMIVILGDRFEALAAAQTSLLIDIPIIHLHGGEITQGAYDDSIRHAITKLSDLHCVSTDCYRERVIQLGESPETVFNVGALGLEYINNTELLSLEELSSSIDFDLSDPYFLMTYHPSTAGEEDPLNTLSSIIEALNNFQNYKVIVTFPNADNGGREIIRLLEDFAQQFPDRVLLTKSLGQLKYLSALKHCFAVVGNSSSGIIEAPSLGVPTVNIGVRQKGRIAADSVHHVATDTDSITGVIGKLISDESDTKQITNPYQKDKTANRILQIIKGHSKKKLKVFYDLPVNEGVEF